MTGQSLQFASAVSTLPETKAAVEQTCQQVLDKLDGKVDLAFAFFSGDHASNVAQLARNVSDRLGTNNLLGCTGESIVGAGQEIENGPAFSLWAASLPGVQLQTLQLRFEQTPDGPTITGWPEELDDGWPEGSSLLLLGEPFTFPTDALLERVNAEHPGVPVVGGMASGGHSPGVNRLVLGQQTFTEGAVGVLLSGNIELNTIVSQGCRPIGQHFVVTKAERNIIYELGGRPALTQLQEIFDQLPSREKAMVQEGLHVGQVVSEYQDTFEQGDFLVRNVTSIEEEDGSIVIGDYVRVGQTVQFHVRDEESADGELKQLLAAVRDDKNIAPLGALLFTCNGRGTRLFSEPHHDAAAIQQVLGELPLAGLFAQGEIGPVAGRNFVHGFTASIALLQAKR
ncbi:MAG: small ligand-binding sensory domain FIST [Pirellulaceae bacterium]|jgi:small ligand-binding sensory domain FIST